MSADVDALLADATDEQVRAWAACWVTYWTPKAVEYRRREAEREYARRVRQTSWDVCSGMFRRPASPDSEAARVQAVLAELAEPPEVLE